MHRLPFFAAFCVCLSLTGCDSDNEEVTATASESDGGSSTGTMASSSGGSSDASASGSGTTEDGGTTVDPTETTSDTESTGDTESGDTESSETGLLGACGEAAGESDCQDTESAQCAWFPTSHVALDNEMTCGDLGIDEGYCLEVDRSDRECSPNHLTTCDAGAVYYRVAGLEVGAIELVIFDDEALCEFPVDFAPCQVNSNPKPGSKPSFFPPECECVCG